MKSARESMSLRAVKPGGTCTVVRLETGRAEHLRRLLALGIMPGASLEVLRRWPAIVFRMGQGEFAIDSQLASSIVVEHAP